MIYFASLSLLALSVTAPSVETALNLLDDWQLEDALEQAQILLAEGPDNPERWLVAAEVLHQRGQHVAALSLLDAVGDAGGQRVAMLRPLIAASAGYGASFQTVETPHFKIRYLNKDEIVALYAQPVLEAAYRAIGGDLELLPAERGEKIVVEIYPDARGLAGATGLTVKEIETSGTIAVCKFHRLMITSPLATADGYAWADTLAHEFTHLVISKKSHNTTPIWLHEGIAKFYESRWKGAAGQNLGAYSEKLLSDAVHSGKFITFEQMHPSMAKLPSQDAAALAFAEVFTMVEYLAGHYGKPSIAQTLALMATGLPLEKVLVKVFGADLKGLEKAWRHDLSKRVFSEHPGASPETIRLATGEDTSREKALEPIQDKAVHDYARLGELLQLRNQPKAAIIEYEKAYAKAGLRYTTLINRLARAYLETERPADAIRLLDAALAQHPDDSDAHLLAGRVRLKNEQWDQAKAHFEAVRLQNPFNPEIHLALSALYDAQGDKAGAERERHFRELTLVPRPTRSYETPKVPASEATLCITSLPWGQVQLDNGPSLPTPAWEVPVKAGAHTLTLLKADGSKVVRQVEVAPGGSQTVVLR